MKRDDQGVENQSRQERALRRREVMFEPARPGRAMMNMAGMMAKYFATSLAMENDVRAPRVISIGLRARQGRDAESKAEATGSK